MVFGFQELKNQLEATCEERDFFQTKYLEQMQELKDLRKALQASQREIKRLRKSIIVTSSSPKSSTSVKDEARQADDDDEALTSTGMRQLQVDCTDDTHSSDVSDTEDVSDGEDMDENAAIRESASKLLEWVDHRQVQQH